MVWEQASMMILILYECVTSFGVYFADGLGASFNNDTYTLWVFNDSLYLFFQMVWEQGSVVLVMLSKLTEDGVAMCHRYWPEEGSDLYHIYEVRDTT